MATTNAIDLSENPQSLSPESAPISFTIETDPQINVDDVLGIIKNVQNQLNAQQSLWDCLETIRKNTDDEDCVHEGVFDALNSKFYECYEDVWMSLELLVVEVSNG